MKKFLLAALLLMPLSLLAQNRWAVVNFSSTFMRENPDYAAENGNQALMGQLVEVLDSSSYWRKVRAEDYTAWLTSMGLSYVSDAEKSAYLRAEKWICCSKYAEILETPRKGAQRICDFIMGDVVRKTGARAKGAYVQVLLPDGKTGWALRSDVMDYSKWAENALWGPYKASDAKEITDFALQFNGTPYLWGANTSKHFDCSGFSKFVYLMHGVILPRNASQQVKVGSEIFTAGIDGTVDLDRLLPGDLLFFGRRATASAPHRITHVAIYLGEGRIIHSSQCVRVSELSDYGREVLAARRILGHIDSGEGVTSVKSSPWWFANEK